MKTCPECGEEVRRRVSDGKNLVCPKCKTPIELVNGEFIKLIYIPPINTLTRILEKTVKNFQHNIYPYRIPQHMLLRTKKILEKTWLSCFPVMEELGINREQALELFQTAFEELLMGISEPERDLGLLLWYISGKDSNKFQRILTKHTMAKKRLMGLNAEEDNWLTQP